MIKNAKESHLRKAKGEKLQKEIVADLKKHFPDHADNIKSSPMSAHGEDVQLTKDALASAKARGVKLGGARPNQKARHDAVKKDADDRAKTVEPVIKAMRDIGNTWDQIAKHMNKLSIPTARGGKWHGKTVLNAHQRLT